MLTDERLKAVCSCIPTCDTFADVGCDHGKVSEFVIKNAIAKKVYACDISQKCLDKAKTLLSGVDGVEFCLSDGLKSVPKVQVEVICGMGASTIQDIISAIDYKPFFVLGAQKNVDGLRKFLSENGFEITKDFVVKEGNLYYDIICAKEGNQRLSETQIHEGVFYKEKDEVRKERLQQKIKTFSVEFFPGLR